VSTPISRRLIAVLGAVIALAALPASARADGDPASDILLFQDVFLPYATPSPDVSSELGGAVAAAKKAGLPLKVAVVQSRSDLGSVGTLFNRPQDYATFLDQELAQQNRWLLIVMPDGYGIAARGGTKIVERNGTTEIIRTHPKLNRELAALKVLAAPASADPDDLTRAATAAVRALGDATSHRLPASFPPVPVGAPGGAVHNGPTTAPPPAAADGGSGKRTLLITVAVVAVLVSASLFVIDAVRSRRLEDEQDDDDDGDHPGQQGGQGG
jgi:hypothetical protein